MYALTVLDHSALTAFRGEHPWLEFSERVSEVCIYFDENGGPTRLTALEVPGDGTAIPADVNTFGIDTVLSLIRYAPQGTVKVEECPEERAVWTLLETLPVADGLRPLEEVEAERSLKLQGAYETIHGIALDKLRALLNTARSPREAQRLTDAIASLPALLEQVGDAHKSSFMEVDLWRMVAILRDELAMPADYEISSNGDERLLSREIIEQAEANALSGPVIQTLFELSPVAFSISSIGQKSSRYVTVNQAYLDLVGKNWDEIRGSEMVASGVVSGSEARAERLMLLDRDGGYAGMHGEIRDASGSVVPVLISARRISVAGQLYDFEVLQRASPE
ncbi:MAG: diguanylate cyclase [Rhizobium sp.]|nr:diguanylate cyclase [Rhizobium sp.]